MKLGSWPPGAHCPGGPRAPQWWTTPGGTTGRWTRSAPSRTYYSQDNKLGSDAAQFTSDEQSYNPDGPVDVSYGKPLISDILPCRRTA
jgi:hypothetical protein